jgi:hypothetical protein
MLLVSLSFPLAPYQAFSVCRIRKAPTSSLPVLRNTLGTKEFWAARPVAHLPNLRFLPGHSFLSIGDRSVEPAPGKKRKARSQVFWASLSAYAEKLSAAVRTASMRTTPASTMRAATTAAVRAPAASAAVIATATTAVTVAGSGIASARRRIAPARSGIGARWPRVAPAGRGVRWRVGPRRRGIATAGCRVRPRGRLIRTVAVRVPTIVVGSRRTVGILRRWVRPHGGRIRAASS